MVHVGGLSNGQQNRVEFSVLTSSHFKNMYGSHHFFLPGKSSHHSIVITTWHHQKKNICSAAVLKLNHPKIFFQQPIYHAWKFVCWLVPEIFSCSSFEQYSHTTGTSMGVHFLFISYCAFYCKFLCSLYSTLRYFYFYILNCMHS